MDLAATSATWLRRGRGMLRGCYGELEVDIGRRPVADGCQIDRLADKCDKYLYVDSSFKFNYSRFYSVLNIIIALFKCCSKYII